jgi:hypothetical protein
MKGELTLKLKALPFNRYIFLRYRIETTLKTSLELLLLGSYVASLTNFKIFNM